MSRPKLLVVEDEADIAEVLRFNLQREGYAVLVAHDGERGFSLTRSERPDLLLLDILLPGSDGIEMLRAVRADPELRGTSVIVVSAKGEESDIVLGLGIGADDYIVKPFRTRELVARVRAVLRRGRGVTDEIESDSIACGALRIDPLEHRVLIDGREVIVTLSEFKILVALASASGRVVSRSKLLERLDGDLCIGERNVDVHITSLRKKLGSRKQLILTVRGVGYRIPVPSDRALP